MAKKAIQKTLPITSQGFVFMGWALFEKSTSKILKRRQATPGTADGSLPIGLDPDLAWLVEQEGDQPTFDTAAERLERGEAVVIDPNDSRTGTLTTTWSIVSLPAEEIKRKNDDPVAAGIEAQVRVAAKKLRNRETITSNQLIDLMTFIVIRDGLHLDAEA